MIDYAPWVGKDNAEVTVLSATPNTVAAVALTGTQQAGNKPVAFSIRFEDGSGALVGGRWAFARAGTITTLIGGPTVTNTDGVLGYTRDSWAQQYAIPVRAKQILIASNTPSAVCYITWFYK